MPNIQTGILRTNFVNSTQAVAGSGGSNVGLTTPGNYTSIASLDSALATANAAYYTTARLDSMTVNDKIFALRSIQDRTTIQDKQPTSTA